MTGQSWPSLSGGRGGGNFTGFHFRSVTYVTLLVFMTLLTCVLGARDCVTISTKDPVKPGSKVTFSCAPMGPTHCPTIHEFPDRGCYLSISWVTPVKDINAGEIEIEEKIESLRSTLTINSMSERFAGAYECTISCGSSSYTGRKSFAMKAGNTDSSRTAATMDDGEGFQTWHIAVIGGVVGFIIIVIIIFLVARRRQRNREETTQEVAPPSNDGRTNPSYEHSNVNIHASSTPQSQVIANGESPQAAAQQVTLRQPPLRSDRPPSYDDYRAYPVVRRLSTEEGAPVGPVELSQNLYTQRPPRPASRGSRPSSQYSGGSRPVSQYSDFDISLYQDPSHSSTV